MTPLFYAYLRSKSEMNLESATRWRRTQVIRLQAGPVEWPKEIHRCSGSSMVRTGALGRAIQFDDLAFAAHMMLMSSKR